MNSTNTTDFFTMHFPLPYLSLPGAVVAPHGQRDFDLTVGLMTRFLPEYIVVQLAKLYRAEFDEVASRLDSCDFQLLAAAADFSVFRLSDPSFDGADELCAVLESDDAHDRIKAHPIAGALDVDQSIAALTQKLCSLDADQGKALWASLVFGQHAPLSEFERLAAPWWSPEFILKQRVKSPTIT